MSDKMREILVDKVTVNIGVGSPGERLDFAKQLLARITGKTPIDTVAKKRNPVFKLRPGMPIGVKVTLRKADAIGFIEKAFVANKRILRARNFDRHGNFSFGVKEYIDFPGAKYDPKIGMFGFDICVTLKRRGKRVQERRMCVSKIGKRHRISTQEAIDFAKGRLNARIEE